MIRLQNSSLELSLSPDRGASIASLTATREGNRYPILVPEHWPQNLAQSPSPMASGCYQMFPYPNRIKHSHFSFEGQEFQLEHADPHALHGYLVDKKPTEWRVTEQEFVATFHHETGYPAAFSVEVGYSLDGDAFTMRASIKNESGRRMPFGGGWHPFFPAVDADGSAVQLRFDAGGVYPTGDGSTLPFPTDTHQSPPAELSWNATRPLIKGLDTCFANWAGTASFHYPNTGYTITVEGSEELNHLVIYSPEGENRFAFEPQTQAINALQLSEELYTAHGVRVLEPGERLEFTMKISVEIQLL